MKTFIYVIAATSLILVSGCREEKSITKLEKAGYTNIELDGMSWNLRCGKTNAMNHKFIAKDRDGKVVKGSVCNTSMLTDIVIDS